MSPTYERADKRHYALDHLAAEQEERMDAEYATYEEARAAADAEVRDFRQIIAEGYVLIAERFTEQFADQLPPGYHFAFGEEGPLPEITVVHDDGPAIAALMERVRDMP
jgi:hypothetical protein